MQNLEISTLKNKEDKEVKSLSVEPLFKQKTTENLNYSEPKKATLDIETEQLFKPVAPTIATNTEIKTEQLFKPVSATEDLEFIEPTKPSSDGVYESKLSLNEESLSPITPVKDDNANEIEAEVLFKSGVEDIHVAKEVKLTEETLTFSEPQKPDLVTEEVLFNSEDTTATENYSFFDVDVNENLGAELAITEDSVGFGDISDITNKLNAPEKTNKPKYIKKKFAQKMLEADERLIRTYDELKNILLSYKLVKSRISNTCDTFNIGRTKLCKLSVSGKSLKLYLNLDYDKVETRLKCKDASHKKSYESVPVFLRIRSDRSIRNAKYLINQLATKFNLKPRKTMQKVDSTLLLVKDK